MGAEMDTKETNNPLGGDPDEEAPPTGDESEATTFADGPTADVKLVERVRAVLGLYRPPEDGTPFQRAWPWCCFAMVLVIVR